MDDMNLSIVEAKKELRLQEWQERIRECRTSGLSVSLSYLGFEKSTLSQHD